MNPAQAVQAAQDLGARHLVPIHPGGEWLPLPPMSWHPGRARHAEAEARRNGLNLCVHVLQRGGTAVLPPAL
jgi:L-ascorbate metabolism protein UlaG (beta-lactamase superfamily)